MAINNTVQNPSGLIPANPFLNSPNLSTGGTTTPSVGGSTLTVQNRTTTQPQGNYAVTPTTSSVNFGGLVPNSSPVGSSASSASQPQSTYQQNLSKYGLTSIPTGYSFNASGQLTNAAGQLYSSPQSQPTPQTSGLLGTPNNTAQSGGLVTPPTTPATNPQNNPYTNTGAPSYSGLVGSLASQSAQPTQAYLDAQEQAKKANEGLAQSRLNEAQSLAQNASNPIPIEFQQGRGQILQNQYLSQQNAYANELQGALGLAGAATAQQGTQQSGLAGAAGLAMPQQVNPTNVPYNPTTGTYGAPASTAYGGANGLQSVGNISGQIGVGQNVAQLNSVLGGAQVVGSNLQDLIKTNNINPSDVTFLNSLNQWLQTGVLSNPKYQEFTGQVNELINSLAPILGAGGSATDMKTQMASQIVNASHSGKSINDVIGYFLDQAKQKIIGLQQGGGIGTSGAQTIPNYTNNGTSNASNLFSW